MNKILSDEEVNTLWNDSFIGADPTSGNQRFKFTKLIEAAILAKLAGMELPKPIQRDDTEHGVDYYTADQLRQAYSQGAAAQLSAESVGDMRESLLIDGLILPVVEVELPVGTALYTRKEAK